MRRDNSDWSSSTKAVGYAGLMQADAYAGFTRLAEPCQIKELAPGRNAPTLYEVRVLVSAQQSRRRLAHALKPI